jgi:translocation and assembly module TamB
VGIDDVGVESDINNDTSLVLGKQLSTRLYISYGISLAEAINTFKARLTLGKGWTLKTESGKARSADIVYTFKKGKKAEDKAEDKK